MDVLREAQPRRCLDLVLSRECLSVPLSSIFGHSRLGDRRQGCRGDEAHRRGDFRPNLHRGGQAEDTDLSETEATLVRRAAELVSLPVCGVDFLHSRDGPVLMEVNASPGLEGK